MKNKLLKLLITILCFVACSIIFIGFCNQDTTLTLILGVIIVLACVALWFFIIEQIYAIILLYTKSKKKKKTSEVWIRVEFIDLENPTHARHVRIYRKENLKLCVQAALHTAKQLELKIDSMTQLTTEE